MLRRVELLEFGEPSIATPPSIRKALAHWLDEREAWSIRTEQAQRASGHAVQCPASSHAVAERDRSLVDPNQPNATGYGENRQVNGRH